MHQSTPNARFWAYINGSAVKITLRPGQSLSWGRSNPTEEGYRYESYEWSHEGHVVRCECVDGGRDCDGVLEHSTGWFCYLGELLSGYRPYLTEGDLSDSLIAPCWEEVIWPQWRRGHSETYDQHAQAMGY